MMTAAELFRAKHPGAEISVGSSGSGAGFNRFLDPQPELRKDINDSSRAIKPEECEKARAVGVEFIELPIAMDGIAVVVNPANDFCDYLTVAELKRIWEPESAITNWKDIRPGFPNLPLKLYGPGTDSGTFDYFVEAVVGKAKACRRDYTASENDNVLVQGVAGDRGGLGYFGFSYYEANAQRIRLLAIDGGKGPVLPSLKTIRGGEYAPLSRPLFAYVSAESARRPEVRAFLDFVFDHATEILEKRRDPFVTLEPGVFAAVRQRLARGVTGTVFGEPGAAMKPLAALYQVDTGAVVSGHGLGAVAAPAARGGVALRNRLIALVAALALLAVLIRRAIGRTRGERSIAGLLNFCAVISVFTTIGITWVLLSESWTFFRAVPAVSFLTDLIWAPLLEPRHYGILPLICGTMLVAAGALVVAIPVGLASAIFLSEYAPPWLREAAKPVLEILAGIPTVVYGYFALTVITPRLLKPLLPDTEVFNAASASIVVGIMIIPTICSLCDDAFRSVPRTLREAGYALSATRMEVSTRIVLPAALSGVVAAVLLGLGRAIGETMAVALAAGQTPKLTLNPLESVQTMTGYVVQVSTGEAAVGSVQYQTIFAVGVALFAITLTINLIAQQVMEHFREAYE